VRHDDGRRVRGAINRAPLRVASAAVIALLPNFGRQAGA
jgi:hypothetical protein